MRFDNGLKPVNLANDFRASGLQSDNDVRLAHAGIVASIDGEVVGSLGAFAT